MSDHSLASAKEVYSSLTVGSNLRNSADVREDQLRKPKKHLSYNSFKSNIGIYSKEIQLFPLELRPVLDDEERKTCSFYKELLTKKQQHQKMADDHRSRAECNSRHRIPRRPRVWDDYPGVERNNFTYGHDVYRNILGPTPDESILAGLQTVIDIMGLSDLIPTESQTNRASKGACRRPSTRESWRADMQCPSQGSSQEELTYPMTTPRRPYSDKRFVRPTIKRGSRETFVRSRHDLYQPTATTRTVTGIQRSTPNRPKLQYPCPKKDCRPGNSQLNGFAARDIPNHDYKTEWSRPPSEQPIRASGSGSKTFQVSSRRKYPPCSSDYDMSYNKHPPCPDCTKEEKPHTMDKHNHYKQDMKKPPNKLAIYETARKENVPDCSCSQTYQKPQKTFLATKQEPPKTCRTLSHEIVPVGELSCIQLEGDNESAFPHRKIKAITYQTTVKDEIITSTPDNSSETITTEHGDTNNSSSLSHKERSEGSSEKMKLAMLRDLKLSNMKDAIDKFGIKGHTPLEPEKVDITEEKSYHSVAVKTQGVQMNVAQMHAEVEVKIEMANDEHGGCKKKQVDLLTDDGTSDESEDDKICRKRHKRLEIRRKTCVPTISFDGERNKDDDKHMSDDDKHSEGYSQIEKVAVGDCGCKPTKPSHPPKDLYATPNHLVTCCPTPKRKTLTYYEMCKYIQTDEVTYPETCPQYKCMKDECCGPDTPCMQLKTKHGQTVCIKYRPRTDSKDLTTQTFPPINLPSAEACGPLTCDCPLGDCMCLPCNCLPEDGEKMECDEKDDGHRKNVLVRDPMHRHSDSSHLFEPEPCNKDYKMPEQKWKMHFRGSGMTVPPVVQPVIGICKEGKCGHHDDKLEEVRYAMVRISVFNEYTTYEVLKSSTRKPKKMPPVVEGIFVTKR